MDNGREEKNVVTFSKKNPKRNGLVEKDMCLWKNSVEIRCKVPGSEKMERIYLVQYRFQRKAVQRGTQKLNIQFHKRQGIS
jgi:hypothetical protein